MQPSEYNITHRQGATYDKTYNINLGATPWNLTSYTGKMQIRLAPEHPTVVTEFKTSDGTMVLGNGTIRLVLPASTWSAIAARIYVHDLELTDTAGKVYPLWYGTFTVEAEVTRG